jgi:hypothetical protein
MARRDRLLQAPRPRGVRPQRWLAALLVLALAGCAQVKEENRRTLNALDAAATPQSEAGRWALSPVALPVGIVALVTDMLVVHPACSLDDAWGDTVQLLWTPRDESRFRRAVLLPLVTLATPLVFAGDWVGRALLPLPPREDDDAP